MPVTRFIEQGGGGHGRKHWKAEAWTSSFVGVVRGSPRKAGTERGMALSAKLGGKKKVWLRSVQTSLTNPNQASPITFLRRCTSGKDAA